MHYMSKFYASFSKKASVILTQKHLSFPENFVHFSKNFVSKAKNEIFSI